MNLLQPILLILFLLTIDAQWYIRRTYQTKSMNYPNPGKRSIYEGQTTFVGTDCLRSYSQLQSYQEKFTWILKCMYTRSSKTNENSLSFYSNNFDIESPTTPTPVLHENRSPHVVSSYFTELNNSFNRFLMKHLQDEIREKNK